MKNKLNVGDIVIMKNQVGKRKGVIAISPKEDSDLILVEFENGGQKVTRSRNVKLFKKQTL